MPKRSRKKRQSKKRAEDRDENQLAKAIVDKAASTAKQANAPEKNPAAVALGKLGGKKGGPARAASLSAERRSEIARRAAEARWQDQNG